MEKAVTEYKIAKEVFALGRDIILSDDAQQMKEFTQHGTTSVFEHVLSVAKFSLIFAINLENIFGFKADRKALIRGALLHDYFLYDWHKPSDKRRGLHGFTHPSIACENAIRDFNISPIEQDIIKHHMFPLTFIWPHSYEGWLVCFADKWCAICETFKIDISSYIIYRVNLHSELVKGGITLGRREASASSKEQQDSEGKVT